LVFTLLILFLYFYSVSELVVVGVVRTPRMNTCIYSIRCSARIRDGMIFRLAAGAVAEVVVPIMISLLY
jgi:hypothetical protein